MSSREPEIEFPDSGRNSFCVFAVSMRLRKVPANTYIEEALTSSNCDKRWADADDVKEGW